MKDVCRQAVERAAGRTLTQAELQGLEDRIKRNQRSMASEDQAAYLGMSPDERLRNAAQRAAEELKFEAGKKRQRIALTIQAHDRLANYMQQQARQHGFSTMESLGRTLDERNDGKDNFQSVASRSDSIKSDSIRQMTDALDFLGPKGFGLFSNKEASQAFIMEGFGQDSSAVVGKDVAATAKKAFESWSKIAESLRQRFNKLGGDVGKIDDWLIPQRDSQSKTLTAGQEAWVDKTIGRVDRSRYIHEDGRSFNDKEMRDLLGQIWLTKATGGANKIEPGKRAGNGMMANRHNKARVLHLKDAQAWLEHNADFGEKDVYSTLLDHIGALSSDIATVEIFGPNPDLQFQYWREKGLQDDVLSIAKGTGENKVRAEEKVRIIGHDLQNLYDEVAGKRMPVASRRMSQVFDTLRNWTVATKLGSAVIPSISDNATMRLTAHYNRLNQAQLTVNQLKVLNMTDVEEKRLARRAGLSLQTYMNTVNRFGSDALGPSFSAKMANLTVGVSGLNAMTEARRRAFGVTMYGSIGHVVKNSADLATMEPQDANLLRSHGVTDENFSVWKKATLENWGDGNDTMLTPEAIYAIPDEALTGIGTPAELRRDAALKLLGSVSREVNMAVVEPSARNRAELRGYVRGTWKGEIMRSAFLFKGFPMAVLSRHWTRGMSMTTPMGKAAYIGTFMAMSTILGGAAVQINNLVSGRDPQDMKSGRFWIASLLKGGGLGIYGDFLFGANTQYGNTPIGIAAGPAISTVEDFIGLTHGNLIKAAQGKKTNFGPEAIRFLKNNTPLQNIWYTKAVTDRIFFNQLQELASPGYMRRIEQQSRSTFGSEYYWHLDDIVPDRAPNAAAAVGAR